MEQLHGQNQPETQVVPPEPTALPAGCPGRLSQADQPLTGRAGALAAVARLYEQHGDELKQLADS